MVVGEEVSCKVLPLGFWYISGEHRLDCLLSLILGTDRAVINIIGDVSIYSGPVNSGLGEVSYLLYASVIVVITEHPLIQLRGIHTLSPFNNIPFSMVNLSLVPQKWHAMWGTSWIVLGQPFKINLYMVLWIGSLSTAPDYVNLSGSKYMLCIF